MPLAQQRSPLSNLGLVAVGQPLDELVGIGRPGSGYHLLVSGVEPPVSDVFHHICREQIGVLLYHADRLSQAVGVDLS